MRGKAKMKTRVGLAVCVMMALVAAEAGRLDRMRSLVKPAFADTGQRQPPPLRGLLFRMSAEAEGAPLAIPARKCK